MFFAGSSSGVLAPPCAIWWLRTSFCLSVFRLLCMGSFSLLLWCDDNVCCWCGLLSMDLAEVEGHYCCRVDWSGYQHVQSSFSSFFFFWCYICGNYLFVHYFGETVLGLHVASLVSKLLCLWKSQHCGWLKDQNGKQMYTKIMVSVKHGVNGIAVEGYFAYFFGLLLHLLLFFFLLFFCQKKKKNACTKFNINCFYDQ